MNKPTIYELLKQFDEVKENNPSLNLSILDAISLVSLFYPIYDTLLESIKERYMIND